MPSSFGLYRCNATGTTDRDSWFESGTGIALCPAFFYLLGDFYLTLRSLMSPGKSSPVIRTGLFLTGDQSHDGGRGEPSKTGAQSALFIVPPNSTSFRRGTGKFICHVKKYGAQSALLVVPPNSAALVRGTGDFVYRIIRTAKKKTPGGKCVFPRGDSPTVKGERSLPPSVK